MRYITAGESHGQELTAIIEGLPAGVPLDVADINEELARRQKGYGRGGRMAIEKDKVRITSGVRHGLTLGSPVTLVVANKDWENWQSVMGATLELTSETKKRRVVKPRPGHADLVGGMKYHFSDLRNVLERSSARETTMRVAIGAVAKKILSGLGITIVGHVIEIAGIEATNTLGLSAAEITEKSEASLLRCIDEKASIEMKNAIDSAKESGDTLGGVIQVIAENVPAGIGSYTQWDHKLDGKIAQAILSINAFKAVSFGVGFKAAKLKGSQVMDEISWEKECGFYRNTNHLGGFEGGMTNGMPLVIQGVMKPIPTLYKPLSSVNIKTKEPFKASVERSDVCAVPAAAVIAEQVVATELVKEILSTFQATSFDVLKQEVADYRAYLKNY